MKIVLLSRLYNCRSELINESSFSGQGDIFRNQKAQFPTLKENRPLKGPTDQSPCICGKYLILKPFPFYYSPNLVVSLTNRFAMPITIDYR